MWVFIIFGLAMIVFMLWVWAAKLYRFRETKLKTRMTYALGMSLFFTLFFLWQTGGKIQVIGKGLLFGMVLSVPLSFYSKRWLDRRMHGTTILYKRKQFLRNLIVVIPAAVVMRVLLDLQWGQQIFDAKWSAVGLGVCWLITQLFILAYIVKLERKLGGPILEDQK